MSSDLGLGVGVGVGTGDGLNGSGELGVRFNLGGSVGLGVCVSVCACVCVLRAGSLYTSISMSSSLTGFVDHSSLKDFGRILAPILDPTSSILGC